MEHHGEVAERPRVLRTGIWGSLTRSQVTGLRGQMIPDRPARDVGRGFLQDHKPAGSTEPQALVGAASLEMFSTCQGWGPRKDNKKTKRKKKKSARKVSKLLLQVKGQTANVFGLWTSLWGTRSAGPLEDRRGHGRRVNKLTTVRFQQNCAYKD